MGACSFRDSARGRNMSEAYKNACHEAVSEYGNDSYNGTISTTSGVTDLTNEFKRSKLSINEFIEKNIDRANKWGPALGVCTEEPIGNTNKIKSQVENIVTSGTKKWVLEFVVSERFGGVQELKSFKTKGEAVKFAREHTEKTKNSTCVDMVKVLEKCSPRVAEIKYKTNPNERDGKYIFFGWAAE